MSKVTGNLNEATDSKFRARLADLGSVAMQLTPADFEKFIVDETNKWAKVILAANIKPE